MKKSILKNKIMLFIYLLLFTAYSVTAQSPLYSGVLVSDTGLNNNLGQANTSRNIAVDAQGNIGVVYIGSSGLRFAKSINRGQSFLPSVQISTASSGDAEVEVADNGNIYVIYSNGSQISLFVSLNGGASFSGPNVLGSGAIPHIASYGSNVYVVPQSGSPIYRNSNNGIGAFSTISKGSWVFADIRVDKANGDVYLIADNPTLYMFRSTNSGATFNAVPVSGSVFYSSYTITTGPLGKYIYVAGQASAGYRIDFTTGASTPIPVGNNVNAQGRTMTSDEFGNFVDGYASASSTMAIRVSNNRGTNFGPLITIANATTHNIARNSATQDVDVVYRGTNGKIYLNVYDNLLLGLTVSKVDQAYCPGSTGTATYSITGANLNANNTFIVQLSDNNRSFVNPTVIGSLTTTQTNGTIGFTIPDSIPSGSNYRIRVVSTSPAASGADNGFDISINAVPTASITAGGLTTFCTGGSVVLTGTLASSGSTYLWNTGDSTRSITVAESGNYTVKITNKCGTSVTSAPVTVTVKAIEIPTITASGKTDLCLGSTVQLSANSADSVSYLWSNGATTPSITVSTGGTYFVKVTNVNGCSAKSANQIVNVGPQFCNTTPVAIAKSINVQAGADCQTFVAAAAFDGGSTDTDGDSLSFSIMPAGPYALGTTPVILTVTDSKGANSTSAATITVEDKQGPTALAKAISVTLVNGLAAITAASVDNGSFDDCGIKSLSIDKSSFDCSNIGSNAIVLTVVDNNDNVSTIPTTVNVIGVTPVASITVTRTDNTFTGLDSKSIALGYGAQSLTLNATNSTSSNDSTTYAWIPAAGLSSSTSASPVFTPTAAGSYTFDVIATNQYGCTTSSSVTITVIDARCGKKVLVCQKTGSAKNPWVQICISTNAVNAHLQKGNTLGTCGSTGAIASISSSNISLFNSLSASVNSLAAYPNPLAKQTTVSFNVAADEAKVSLDLYNVSGAKVQNIYSGPARAVSEYTFSYDALGIAPGVYFFKLTGSKVALTFKVIVTQ